MNEVSRASSERRWAVGRGERTWFEFRENHLNGSATGWLAIRDEKSGQRLAQPLTVDRPDRDFNRPFPEVVQKLAGLLGKTADLAEVEWAAYWSGKLWC